MSFRGSEDVASPSSAVDGIDNEIDALELAALENATSPREEMTSNEAIPRPLRRPLRRSGSSVLAGEGERESGQQASRLLEALEALSSESGGAMPPSLRSLLGQLQGDEQALAGLFPFMQLLDSHGSQPRFQRMLQSIDADAPPHAQLSGLSELCESLSMSSEESLMVSGFSVDKFLPPVMQLIRAPSTMEVLLMAARALSSMFDLFPTIAIPKAMANGSGLVESICAKLLEIEYMDVAELAFQILERIVFCPQSETSSTDYRRAVIAANGFVALLQFVDFFPIEIQRTATRVVAGLCNNIGVESTEELQVALPLIAGLLCSSDADIMQQGCKCFQSLSASPTFSAREDFAHLVANEEICESLARLLESFACRGDSVEDAGSSSAPISVSSCVSILEFMSAVLSSPHHSMEEQVKRLRFKRIPPTVAKLLDMQTIGEDVILLRETLKLAISILPPAESLEHQETEDEWVTIQTFVRSILPSAIRVFEVSSRQEVRYDCLGVILRVCLLQQHIEHTEEDFTELAHLSSFLARVLRPEVASEPSTKMEGRNSCVALQISQACLHSEGSFSTHAKTLFERHGVSAAIRRFATADDASEDEGLGALSRLLVSEYLGEEDTSSEPSMEKLQQAVRLLGRSLNDKIDDHGERCTTLSQGLDELSILSRERQSSSTPSGAWLTAHEMASSGLSALLNRMLQDTEGRRIFADKFIKDTNVSGSGTFLDGLIASVQDAISAEKDAFRVDISFGGSTIPVSTGSVTNDMDQLSQHIKVRVKIDDSDISIPNTDVKRNKRSVHDTVVLVEPLARIDTIEEFIAERLFGSRSPFGALTEEDDDFMRRHRRQRSQRDENEGEGEEKRGNDDHDDDEETEDDPDDDHDDESDELRSDRPEKQKRLQVLYRGSVMPAENSVLEAILKTSFTQEGESGSSDLVKVWTGSPHEFVFRVLSKDSAKPAPIDVEGEVASVKNPPTDAHDSQMVWWDNVGDLLGILKHLHELLGKSKSSQLVNAYVSLQVNRALTQPVRVMTHSLPAWSFRIVEDYPFVLDYDTRYDFMFATTCGAPRAISYLCRKLWKKAAMAEEPQPVPSSGRDNGRLSRRSGRDRGGASSVRNATTALTNLSRMAKLPRLKVRVARSRLLQSAMKLFSMYGGKKAIIEIEFLGEVGTGLGPTTEFYTLVCHELQATHLKLWRNDKDVSTEDDDTDDNTSFDSTKSKKKKLNTDKTKKSGIPIRGYHRMAVYHCPSCKHLEIPRCAIHDQLLTSEKSEFDEEDSASIPQCSTCLDTRDWHSAYLSCKSCCNKETSPDVAAAPAASEETVELPSQSSTESIKKQCTLKWWILSEEEATYLRKVYPRDVESIKHPVLQCSHCDTVNFPGTDAGIVVLDHTGERMVSRAGRRMYERDYRAVTKHVSPLCEGTPLKQIGVVLTRDAVDTLVDCIKKSPELLDSEVESLCYMSEVAMHGEVEVVDAPFGLFPKPYKPKTPANVKSSPLGVLSWFNFMGRFVAQALLDERLINLPLSRAFLRALRGEVLVGAEVDMAHSLKVVQEVDPAIAQSLMYLHTFATEAVIETDPAELEAKTSLVDSMCLSFTLVGDGSIALCDNGKNIPVTLANLGEYVQLNMKFLLAETIKHQVTAFHDGFQTISGCADARKYLQIFSLEELEFLFADKWLPGDSMWDRDGKELREHMICDHGYSSHSRAIHNLVTILCEMPLEEQRLFVKFVTGANRLPLGGLAKLEPKLTVVRKLASTGETDDFAAANDAVLPSASTCTNYLKLPEYTTLEIMKDRLAYCIREGQGSFHLS